MGTSQIASAPSTGGKIFYKMLHFVLLLSASSLAMASCGPALGLGPDIGPRYGYSSGYQQQHTCHTVYDSATDTACHTEHDQICHTEQDQVCHTEFDTVVDTTYVEDCQGASSGVLRCRGPAQRPWSWSYRWSRCYWWRSRNCRWSRSWHCCWSQNWSRIWICPLGIGAILFCC